MAIPYHTLNPQEWDKILRSSLFVQSGSGIVGYKGLSQYQRGYGLGSILRSIFRIAKPVVTKVAKNIAKEGIESAALIGSDLLEGQNFKSSIKSRAKEGANRLVKKGVDKVYSPRLGGYEKFNERKNHRKKKRNQKGSGPVGYKRKKKSIKINRKQIGYGRKRSSGKKLKKSDYFGKI